MELETLIIAFINGRLLGRVALGLIVAGGDLLVVARKEALTCWSTYFLLHIGVFLSRLAFEDTITENEPTFVLINSVYRGMPMLQATIGYVVISAVVQYKSFKTSPYSYAKTVSFIIRGTSLIRRELRKTLVRYAILSLILTMRMVSADVVAEYRTLMDLVQQELLMENTEYESLMEAERQEPRKLYMLPMSWAGEVLRNARFYGYIRSDRATRKVQNLIVSYTNEMKDIIRGGEYALMFQNSQTLQVISNSYFLLSAYSTIITYGMLTPPYSLLIEYIVCATVRESFGISDGSPTAKNLGLIKHIVKSQMRQAFKVAEEGLASDLQI